MKKLISVALLLASTQLMATELIDVNVTAGMPESCENVFGDIYYRAAFTFQYRGGKALLAGDEAGTANTYVDDAIRIRVTRPDGSTRVYRHLYGFDGPNAPVDLAYLFQRGANKVTIEFSDIFGGCVKSSGIWLLNR